MTFYSEIPKVPRVVPGTQQTLDKNVQTTSWRKQPGMGLVGPPTPPSDVGGDERPEGRRLVFSMLLLQRCKCSELPHLMGLPNSSHPEAPSPRGPNAPASKSRRGVTFGPP